MCKDGVARDWDGGESRRVSRGRTVLIAVGAVAAKTVRDHLRKWPSL